MNILRKAIHYLWLHGWKYRVVECQQRRYVADMQGRSTINVVFTAIDIALWRYQYVYELMVQDKRFNVNIVLTPCLTREHVDRDMEGLRQYFDKLNIPYIDYKEGEKPFDFKKELNPDIVFYTQPYEYLLSPVQDCRNMYDRLLCYMPYAFWTATGKLSYDLHFENQAWRLYYSTDMHRQDAVRMATNHGRNVRVVGYANADKYLTPHHESPWNKIADGKKRKRLIWAPHYTILSKSTFPPRSNFLWMAELMLRLATDYTDSLQIAFKPHPTLLTQLYQHKDWGKERTDRYYAQWENMPNTQLETGEFIDLFMTSDAMVHDSASFTVEYHYSQRPSMFVSKNTMPLLDGMNDFGKKAFAQHYIGKDETDIRHFIDDVVIRGNDTMKTQREQFFRDYLLPPNGKSVAQNVVDDIVDSLNLHY